MKYEVMLGFNTKQWWIYNNDTDMYCDPPAHILDQVKQHSPDINVQQAYLERIVATNPDWLQDPNAQYNKIE